MASHSGGHMGPYHPCMVCIPMNTCMDVNLVGRYRYEYGMNMAWIWLNMYIYIYLSICLSIYLSIYLWHRDKDRQSKKSALEPCRIHGSPLWLMQASSVLRRNGWRTPLWDPPKKGYGLGKMRGSRWGKSRNKNHQQKPRDIIGIVQVWWS